MTRFYHICALVGLIWLTNIASLSAQAIDLDAIDLDNVPEVQIRHESANWYVKGWTGIALGDDGDIEGQAADIMLQSGQSLDLGDGALLGAGIGYRINDIIRVEASIEQRFRQTLSHNNQNYGRGKFSSTLIMANLYTDLGTYKNVTPFVGFGLGAAANRVSDMENYLTSNTSSSKTNWDFAWGLHAGFAYKLNSNNTLELSYSYHDLGEANTNFAALGTLNIDHITAHDIKIGWRYSFH